MDAPDAVAIVKKLKDKARASPWIPAEVPPREHYHHLPNGLNLCLSMDILPKEYINQLAQAIGTKPPEESGGGGSIPASKYCPTGGSESYARGGRVLVPNLL